jgi:dihydrodipicolinate reductase
MGVEMTIRILLNGAKGRMGQAIQACARGERDMEIAAALDVGNDPELVIAGSVSYTHLRAHET